MSNVSCALRVMLALTVSAGALGGAGLRQAATSAPPAASPPATAPSSVPAAIDVSGVGLMAMRFDADSLGRLPRTSLKVSDKEGVESTWEGVRVSDILMAAGMKFGQSLRGPRLLDYLIAEAGDGYRVLFALPEFDPDFSDRTIIVADLCDGKPVTGRDGPFKIIVSDERKHARWVRNVTKLTIQSTASDVPPAAPQPPNP